MNSHTILIHYTTVEKGTSAEIATCPALPDGSPDTETAIAAVRGIIKGSYLTLTDIHVGTIHEHRARVVRKAIDDPGYLGVESHPLRRDH